MLTILRAFWGRPDVSRAYVRVAATKRRSAAAEDVTRQTACNLEPAQECAADGRIGVRAIWDARLDEIGRGHSGGVGEGDGIWHL